MIKSINKFSHYVLKANKGMTLTNGKIYTKMHISANEIDESAWTEVDDSEVPVNDELTDSEALALITGGSV